MKSIFDKKFLLKSLKNMTKMKNEIHLIFKYLFIKKKVFYFRFKARQL